MALQLADTAILPFDVQNYAQVFDRGKKFLVVHLALIEILTHNVSGDRH
jgi:hypothetical protein